MNSSVPTRRPAPRPPTALLLAVAILGVASLLPRIFPAWFAAPPARVNFLGTGAPFLLFIVLRPRWSWAWRLTQCVAILSASAALAVGLWLTHGYVVGWSVAAALCALAFAILTRSGAVRDYFTHRRSTAAAFGPSCPAAPDDRCSGSPPGTIDLPSALP